MVVVAGKVGRFVEIISFVYVVDLVVRTFFLRTFFLVSWTM